MGVPYVERYQARVKLTCEKNHGVPLDGTYRLRVEVNRPQIYGVPLNGTVSGSRENNSRSFGERYCFGWGTTVSRRGKWRCVLERLIRCVHCIRVNMAWSGGRQKGSV